MEVRSVSKVLVYDAIPEQSKRFAEEMNKQFRIPVMPKDSAQEVAENVDILVTSTNSKTPIIKDDWVKPGLHITSMGVSAPGSQEIATETFKRSKLVIDDYAQTSVMGGINVPITQGSLKKEDVFAEIGEILLGKKTGRTSDSEITISLRAV